MLQTHAANRSGRDCNDRFSIDINRQIDALNTRIRENALTRTRTGDVRRGTRLVATEPRPDQMFDRRHERRPDRHILRDNRLKPRIVLRTHPRTTTDTNQQRSPKNERNGLQRAAPTTPFTDLLRLPQWRYSHAVIKTSDLNKETRRIDIGVLQFAQ
jgi:hypothetical protein